MKVYTEERIKKMDAEEKAHLYGIINDSKTLSQEEKKINSELIYPPRKKKEK